MWSLDLANGAGSLTIDPGDDDWPGELPEASAPSPLVEALRKLAAGNAVLG